MNDLTTDISSNVLADTIYRFVFNQAPTLMIGEHLAIDLIAGRG